ncbi:HAD family hydrolase [Chitinibacteraceae bacterium HSL-7]
MHAQIRAVLTDVDDTLTWQGRLPVAALDAMARLEAAGIALIPVTGACAGWCDQMARTWPVAAVIGENGAFVIERQGRRLRYHDTQDAATRGRHRTRIEQVADVLLAQFPGLAPAQDNGYRRYDLALDHAQEVEPLPAATVDLALAAAHTAGVAASASSIHINLWLGDFSKRLTAERWLQQRYGWDEAARRIHAAFVGDSPNDAQMFAAFAHTVGVANVRAHLPRLATPPAHITTAPGGLGFAEWVDALLTKRACLTEPLPC